MVYMRLTRSAMAPAESLFLWSDFLVWAMRLKACWIKGLQLLLLVNSKFKVKKAGGNG